MGDIPPVTIRSIAGLWSSPNPFSKVPEGALEIADDVVIRASGMLEPRRGFAAQNPGAFIGATRIISRVLPTSVNGTRFAALYGGFPFFWDIASQFAFSVPVSPLTISTPVAAPYATDARVAQQGQAANSSFVWTNANAPLSAALPGSTGANQQAVTRYSGLPKAIAPLSALIAAVGNALMSNIARRTYRITLAVFDVQGNFYESSPSEPVWIESSCTITIAGGAGTITATVNGTTVSVVWAVSDAATATALATAITNAAVGVTATAVGGVISLAATRPSTVTVTGTGASATAAKTPQLTLRWPPSAQVDALGGTLSPFFRVWRGLETAPGVPSNDEMFLTREFLPPSYGLGPQGFQDTNTTYTVNDVSIDSLLNVPLYTNPQTGDGLGILSANRRPPVSSCVAYFKGRMYYGRCTYQQQLQIQVIGTGTGGISPGDTATLDGLTFTAGGAGLEATGIFNCPTTAGQIAQNIETTAKSLIECIRYAYGNSAGPGYSRSINRQLYAYYASSDVSDFGRIIIERPLPFASGDDAGISFTVTTVSPGIRFPAGSTTSSDDYSQGGVSWSKPNQPEAVPDINFQIVGDEAKAVLGFSVHRDCMIAYKEDGAYIVRDDGSQAGPSFDLLDTGVICVAPASIAVVSNLAYLLATRGVLQVSEQGTELMSVPIATELLKLFEQSSNNLAAAYGFGSEATRQYVLGVPAGPNEAAASLQYVLRVPEDDSPQPKWTRWTLPGTNSGCALPVTGQFVFAFNAPSLAVTNNTGLLVERFGNVCSLDYQDAFKATTQPAPASGTTDFVVLTSDLRALIGTGDLLFYNPGGGGAKGYTPRVLAVAFDSSANHTTLTLDTAVLWSGGTFLVQPAIRAHWRFSPITGGEPTMEKQWDSLQAYFTYCDADWIDVLLDSEESPLTDYSRVFLDPQLSTQGAEIQGACPLTVSPAPSPALAVGKIQWLRNCRDVGVRLDPAGIEARGRRLGVEMQHAQALSRFRLAAVCATINEVIDSGGR